MNLIDRISAAASVAESPDAYRTCPHRGKWTGEYRECRTCNTRIKLKVFPCPHHPHGVTIRGDCKRCLVPARAAPSPTAVPLPFSVSVVIPTLNDWVEAWRTADAFNAHFAAMCGSRPREMLLVDDAGKSPWREPLPSHRSNCRVMRHAERLGVDASRNDGIKATEGDLTVLADSHVAPVLGNLAEACAFAMQEQAIVVPTHQPMSYPGFEFPVDKPPWRKYGAYLRIIPENPIPACAHNEVVPAQRFTRATGLLGGCYLLPRSVIERIGPIQTTVSYWGYSEEFLALAAFFLQIPIYTDRDAVIAHKYWSRSPQRPNPIPYPHSNEYWKSNCIQTLRAWFDEATWRTHWQPLLKAGWTKRNGAQVAFSTAVFERAETPVRVVQQTQTRAKRTRTDQEFLDWIVRPWEEREQPLVSAMCATYGRPEMLEEAIESFHRQDYAGPKELVILNDLASQVLEHNHPDVRIINADERYATLGDKRNAMAALCRGRVLIGWDDDDISLPWRITQAVEQLREREYFKPNKAFILTPKGIAALSGKSPFPTQFALRRTLFDRAGGYRAMNSGQDIELERRFRGHARTTALEPVAYPYMYRWQCGTWNLSAFGRDEEGETSGYERIRERAEETPKGRIILEPQWRADYVAMQRAFVARLAGGPAIMPPDSDSAYPTRTHFLGGVLAHRAAERGLLERILQGLKIQNILELGTGAGVLTTLFGIHAALHGGKVLSIEKAETLISLQRKRLLACLPVALQFADVFAPEAKDVAARFLESAAGPVLCYCDDGNKPRELREFAEILRAGDVLGVHDWGSEVSDKDVPPIVRERFIPLTADAPNCRQRFWQRG